MQINRYESTPNQYLKTVLGENLDEFLEHVYNTASPFIADPEDESDEEEKIDEPDKLDYLSDFSSKINAQELAVSESKLA